MNHFPSLVRSSALCWLAQLCAPQMTGSGGREAVPFIPLSRQPLVGEDTPECTSHTHADEPMAGTALRGMESQSWEGDYWGDGKDFKLISAQQPAMSTVES